MSTIMWNPESLPGCAPCVSGSGFRGSLGFRVRACQFRPMLALSILSVSTLVS